MRAKSITRSGRIHLLDCATIDRIGRRNCCARCSAQTALSRVTCDRSPLELSKAVVLLQESGGRPEFLWEHFPLSSFLVANILVLASCTLPPPRGPQLDHDNNNQSTLNSNNNHNNNNARPIMGLPCYETLRASAPLIILISRSSAPASQTLLGVKLWPT